MKIGMWRAVVLAGVLVTGVRGADPKTPIPDDQVDVAAIRAVMEQAAFTAEVDEDGDVKVADGGLITFIRLDAERKVISFFAFYRIKAAATELQRLQLINRLNDKVLLARFSAPNERMLWCDYQFGYEGGITPFWMVTTFRQFTRVLRASVGAHDTEDIIGED